MAVELTGITRQKISKDVILNVSTVVGPLILAIILWILFIAPKASLIGELKRKIKSVSALKDEAIVLFVKEKDELVKRRDAAENKIMVSKKRLSEKKDVPMLLDKFILIAQRRKLEFTYIKPLQKKNKILEAEGVKMIIKEIPVSLEMEAGFAEFLGFLWETEHSEEIFKITDLTIGKNPKSPLRHKEKITLSVYQLTEEVRNDKK